ncbi:MAG TPA: GNAT family protein [Acidimicrobiales bacterium]
MYPVTIAGPRVILREFEPDDLDPSMAVVGDDAVTRTLSFDSRTRDEQAARLADDIARARSEPRSDYYLAIVAREGDAPEAPAEAGTPAGGPLIGFVRLGLLAHRAGELGYALRRDRWGQGYAHEAARLMLDFTFTTVGLHRVQAACGPDNERSRALLERIGFRCEGRIRDHVFTNGAWRDSLLYSLLEHEWRGWKA